MTKFLQISSFSWQSNNFLVIFAKIIGQILSRVITTYLTLKAQIQLQGAIPSMQSFSLDNTKLKNYNMSERLHTILSKIEKYFLKLKIFREINLECNSLSRNANFDFRKFSMISKLSIFAKIKILQYDKMNQKSSFSVWLHANIQSWTMII